MSISDNFPNKTRLSAGRPSEKKKVDMRDDVLMVRINAQVTEDEHQKLKMYAVKNKKSISDLLRAYIATLPE